VNFFRAEDYMFGTLCLKFFIFNIFEITIFLMISKESFFFVVFVFEKLQMSYLSFKLLYLFIVNYFPLIVLNFKFYCKSFIFKLSKKI